jgi:D-methionine transport system substrate-binding protein
MNNLNNLALIPLSIATWQTIYMVFIASFCSIFFGLIVGILLFATSKNQLLENKRVNRVLGLIVNLTRSVPFIILLIGIIPFTRLIVGTSIGVNAAVVPLTIAAIPFFARIVESSVAEVSPGLIEAAHALGATSWQTIYKVLIPESLPSLIKGATLTIITLVGYSAMAGAVGGGGLGELAINYGYQRFNLIVMIETIVLLIIIVQLIQSLGNHLTIKPKLKWVGIGCLLLWVVCIGSQVWHPLNQNTIKVGIVGGSQENILQVAKQVAQKNYGLKIKLVIFNDYQLPNEALNDGDIDANIFQHEPFLQAQIKAHGYHLTSVGKTFVYPFGFYSRKFNKLSQLKYGATVAIPNDPSNEGRALLLLQQARLIKLKVGAGLFGTPRDIVNNPKNLRFKILDAAQLPRVFQDVDLVGLTNDYIKAAGFTPQDALIKEGANSPYANIIVVRNQNKNKSTLKELVAVMHSQKVLQATEKLFPHGAAIPAWHCV